MPVGDVGDRSTTQVSDTGSKGQAGTPPPLERPKSGGLTRDQLHAVC